MTHNFMDHEIAVTFRYFPNLKAGAAFYLCQKSLSLQRHAGDKTPIGCHYRSDQSHKFVRQAFHLADFVDYYRRCGRIKDMGSGKVFFKTGKIHAISPQPNHGGLLVST